jgi:uncharacterized protein YndB with AHSA1/START domain
MPDHISIETVTFEAHNGKTKLTNRVLYQTVEDLEAVVKSGMEVGAVETMERFGELLAEFAKSGGERR